MPPNGPDRRTDTYVYKDRRYGYRPSYLDPVYRGPTKAPDTRYLYEVRYSNGAIKLHNFFFFYYKNYALSLKSNGMLYLYHNFSKLFNFSNLFSMNNK